VDIEGVAATFHNVKDGDSSTPLAKSYCKYPGPCVYFDIFIKENEIPCLTILNDQYICRFSEKLNISFSLFIS